MNLDFLGSERKENESFDMKIAAKRSPITKTLEITMK